MIIKSMSRKSNSFSQLYDYLTREKSSFTFSRNTYTNPTNKKEFIKEFYDNARYLKNSRGKVFLYHEVLSLEKNELSIERQKEILLDLAYRYLQQRADEHLAFGVIHEEKNNIHIHLMLSANEIEKDKRVRLTKADFSDIQKRMENYKNEKFKELGKSSLYQEKKDISKSKQNEQELRNRTNKTIKDEIKQNLKQAFKKANSKEYINNHLKSLDYEIYSKGKTIGISYNNKNYRLKTLGLEQDYKELLSRLEKSEKRKEKRQQTKDENVKSDRFYRKIYMDKSFYSKEQERGRE
jgi:hypothetical protein